jgi:hypothetical protein
MATPVSSEIVVDGAVFDVRVIGPDCDALTDADLRRLFPGSCLTDVRLNRLRQWPRAVVSVGGRVAAVATCQKSECEMRVPDLGLDAPAGGCFERDVLNALFDAIELGCVAGGCRRVIISPPRTSFGFLERRGYVRVNERCAGGWIEKNFSG